jgi:hypothetical protein
MLVDMENRTRGFCIIEEVAEPIAWDDIAMLGDVKGERTPYNTGPKLAAGLEKFYGPSAASMDWCAISYITFLAELPLPLEVDA